MTFPEESHARLYNTLRRRIEASRDGKAAKKEAERIFAIADDFALYPDLAARIAEDGDSWSEDDKPPSLEKSVEQDSGSTAVHPRSWQRFTAKCLSEKIKRVLILGATDTGKSYFSRHLAEALLAEGQRVALIDTDTGQSDIGPPSCMGLLRPRRAIDLENPDDKEPDEIAMVGSYSASLHFSTALSSLHRLLSNTSSEELVIINTDGWIAGGGGRALKHAMIELANPDYVVMLQREKEAEHLIAHLDRRKTVRLRTPKSVPTKSGSRRAQSRMEGAIEYMSKAREVTLSRFRTDRSYYGSGITEKPPIKIPGLIHAERLNESEGWLLVTKKSLPNKAHLEERLGSRIIDVTQGHEENALVALLDKSGTCLGLGVIRKLDYAARKAQLITPVSPIQKVTTLQFSSLRWTPTGNPAEFLKPGTI